MRKIKHLFSKKLHNSRGETITETIVSLLIITLAMTMLAGSIVSASRVNRKVKDADTSFRMTTDSGTAGKVTILQDNAKKASVDVNIYTTSDDNKYIYYERKQ